jgi:hypothetical protein
MSETTEPHIPTPEELNLAATIDADALAYWLALPETASIVLHASRADLDRLFLGLRMLAFAQGDALAAFQNFTHGETDAAQRFFASAAARHGAALANISAFTTGIMAKAQVDG